MQQGYAKELLRRVPFEMNPILRNAALDSARIHLRNALEIYPKGEAETFSALASYFDLAQSYDSAAFYAEKALSMSPETRTYRKNLGVIHSNKGVDFAQAGNFRAAVECFKKAYLLDSANAILCGNIGGAYASMQERDSAIVFLQKAVTLDPMLPSARQNLERLRAQQPN
jgi:tetratricopeptide (TPR) repeat protein